MLPLLRSTSPSMTSWGLDLELPAARAAVDPGRRRLEQGGVALVEAGALAAQRLELERTPGMGGELAPGHGAPGHARAGGMQAGERASAATSRARCSSW